MALAECAGGLRLANFGCDVRGGLWLAVCGLQLSLAWMESSDDIDVADDYDGEEVSGNDEAGACDKGRQYEVEACVVGDGYSDFDWGFV